MKTKGSSLLYGGLEEDKYEKNRRQKKDKLSLC